MKNKSIIGITILILLLSGLNPITSSDKITSNNIIYVDDDGGADYTKIQDAINNASDGDTIFVYNGTYYENITVDKSIILIGENKEYTIIDGSNKSEAIISILSNKTYIQGFTIQNTPKYFNNRGIWINSSKNEIIDNKIYDTYTGIYINGYNNTIRQNILYGNDGIPIWIGNNYNKIIENNIYRNDASGISIFSNYNEILKNNVKNNTNGISITGNYNNISNNLIENNLRSGIQYQVGFSDFNKICNNVFIGNNLNLFGYSNVEYYNLISNNSVNGKPLIYLENESNLMIDYETGQIILMGCNNITISYQEIRNTDNAVTLWQSDDCKIINNKFDLNKKYSTSINIQGCNNISIISNEITDSEYGINYDSSNYINTSENIIKDNIRGLFYTDSHYNMVSKNNILNNSVGLIFSSYAIYPNCKNNNVVYNNFRQNYIGLAVFYGVEIKINYNNFYKNLMSLTFWVPRTNNFNYNYWDHPRILPKLLIGSTGHAYLRIPWIVFDWHPAKEPYDI